MATYKVPQDVEAEDKLVGPFTLKQFIFGIIALIIGYIAFTFSQINIALVVPFIVPFALFAFLAAPISRDQPTDVYLGARLRFFFKPKRRIWDQAGQVDLVKITAPIQMLEPERTDGLDQTQVESRLKMLASTIDTRGWATKNVFVNEGANQAQQVAVSDRLVMPQSTPQLIEDPGFEITAADDVLDPMNNPTAQRMSQLASQATSDARERAVSAATSPQPQQPQPYQQQISDDDLSEDEAKEIIKSHSATPYPEQMRQRVLRPISEQRKDQEKAEKSRQTTPTVDPAERAKLELSRTNDLSVDTIAREADRVEHQDGDNEEVVIRLR